jgi:hypothetical protein
MSYNVIRIFSELDIKILYIWVVATKTKGIMKGLKLSDSIYGNGMMGSGLSVQGGRLINNRPCGTTGIAEAASARKMMKRADKVGMIADGVSMGNMRSEMIESQFEGEY